MKISGLGGKLPSLARRSMILVAACAPTATPALVGSKPFAPK
jgi:hypothetical protein